MNSLSTPLREKDIKRLRAGDRIFLSGIVYTARDMAHKKLVESLEKNNRLPVSLKGAVIYYTGPTPTPPGKIIGSCGPTTSSRMDAFTIPLLRAGLKGMIGKGSRSPEVRKAIKQYRCIYFVTIAGAGALLSSKVIQKKLIAYKELGPEAIYELEVKDFPVIVGIDARGRDVYSPR